MKCWCHLQPAHSQKRWCSVVQCHFARSLLPLFPGDCQCRAINLNSYTFSVSRSAVPAYPVPCHFSWDHESYSSHIYGSDFPIDQPQWGCSLYFSQLWFLLHFRKRLFLPPAHQAKPIILLTSILSNYAVRQEQTWWSGLSRTMLEGLCLPQITEVCFRDGGKKTCLLSPSWLSPSEELIYILCVMKTSASECN